MYVCMYVWMDACMHACMHVCIYIFIYIYIFICIYKQRATETDFISFSRNRIMAENLQFKFGRNRIMAESLQFSFSRNRSQKCVLHSEMRILNTLINYCALPYLGLIIDHMRNKSKTRLTIFCDKLKDDFSNHIQFGFITTEKVNFVARILPFALHKS